MAETTRTFSHVILTRFNTRLDESAPVPDDEWTDRRFALFERYCVPSVRRQSCPDFSWVVFFDAETGAGWRGRAEDLARSAGFRIAYLDGPFDASRAAAAIRGLGLDDPPYLVTSRLDNDDALAPHYVEAVRRAFRPQQLEFLNFPLGYQLAGGRVFLRPHLASAFAALVERSSPEGWRTVYFTPHHLIGRHPVRQLCSPPAWMQVVHGDNLANEVRGIPVHGAAALERIRISSPDPVSPRLLERVGGSVRLAVRAMSTADARERVTRPLTRAGSVGSPTARAVEPVPVPDPPALPRVTAILTCHNRRELTLRALRGWFGQQGQAAELAAVVVDDGGTDGTWEAVGGEFPAVQRVRGDGSLFWAGGMAVAEAQARRSDPDALVWLNDDVELATGALDQLLATSHRSVPPAVVAGALADPGTGQPTYGAVRPRRWHPLRVRPVVPSGSAQPIDAMHGNLVYVPRPAYLAAGAIDGGFAHAYADFDYGLRLRKLGYPVVLSAGALGWCSRSTTSRRPVPAGLPLRARLSALNSPRGLPLRSQARYLRRHAGPWWPVLVLVPYGKELAREVVRACTAARP